MTVYLQDTDLALHHGDCLEVLRTLPDRSVHMCATSPPFYGLRDYGTGEWEGGDPDCDHQKKNPASAAAKSTLGPNRDGLGEQNQAHQTGATFTTTCGKCGARRVDQQIGLEETPDQWVERLVEVFREVRRVLRDDGTLWVEIGDSYAHPAMGGTAGSSPDGPRGGRLTEQGRSPSTMGPGLKQKDLLGQPWLLAFALRADGWFLRSEIIWARPNPMPESVTDRPTKSHSTVFLLSKKPRYFYDADAIREPPHQGDNGWRYYANRGLPQPNSNLPRHTGTHQPKDGGNSGLVAADRDTSVGANARSVWQIPTEPTPFAHFATWPRKLVARMILAGTSERGCCPECGAPWVRDVARDLVDVPGGSRMDAVINVKANGDPMAKGQPRAALNVTTLGWSPSCVCYDKTPDSDGPLYGTAHAAPCTVLDPFAGSGTTLLVARQHGRHSIGIELNPAYCELVRDRTSQQSLLADAQ